MAERIQQESISSQLLALDARETDDQYVEYRQKLTRALDAARRSERIAYWICAVTGPISMVLMFVGGSRVVGSFDPWDKDATPWSMGLGVIYVASSIVFWVGLASFYSRFRPRTRAAEENLRESHWMQMAAQLTSLQKDVELLKRGRLE
ncbi:MAG: hypothetical protein U1A77_25975 [Pirellulales bacterium]